jgi:exopolysaccharide biosynthesis polyprenyl glycosylphosphotransferase
VGLFVASWFTTAHAKYPTPSDILSMQIKISNLIGLLTMAVVWQMICNYFHLYHSRRLQRFIREWKDIVKATTTGTIILFLGAGIFGILPFTTSVVSAFWISTTLLTICFRTSLRYVLGKVRLRGRNLRSVLMVGTNEKAHGFARMLAEDKERGYLVAGYVDDLLYSPNGDTRLLGSLEDFPDVLRNHIIDEVVIALPIKSQYERIQKIITVAEEQGITIRCLSHPFNTKIAKSNTVGFGGCNLLEISSKPQDDFGCLAKRTVDIVLAATLLLLALPVMLVVAIAIKLTSPGPVFFVQDRIGYNKRIFLLYKFRTMVADAERAQKELETQNEMDGPVFKIKNDPRITRVGSWLRRTSLDELPQLYNVLRGHMSLVGPRPLPVRDYNGFRKDWQRRRFSVRPGLTCLWQINGRNHTSFEHWMKLDMEYIDNWSLLGDMKILLQTIPAVINGKGAS